MAEQSFMSDPLVQRWQAKLLRKARATIFPVVLCSREALNMSQAKKVAGNEKIKQSRLASLRLSRSAVGDDRKAGHRRGEQSRAVIEQK